MIKRKPKEGTPAWDKSLRDNAGFVQETIRSVADRAAAGEPGAADLLARWLAEHPEHRADIKALDDLTTKAVEAWVELAGGGHPVAEQAARDEAAALRAELLPPDAGILDRVLAGAVVVAHLSHAHAALAAAAGTDLPGVRDARDRRLSSAQKRLLAAAKGLRTVAAKKHQGARTPQLRLFADTGTAGPG